MVKAIDNHRGDAPNGKKAMDAGEGRKKARMRVGAHIHGSLRDSDEL